MIARLLTRWAEPAARKRALDLETELDIARRALAICEAERDALAAVVARDRARIQAEGAAYARQRAEAEGVASEQRHNPRPG